MKSKYVKKHECVIIGGGAAGTPPFWRDASLND